MILRRSKEWLMILRSLLYIFVFLALGEIIVYFLFPYIPGNIVGMFLIFFALKFRIINLQDVKPASDKLMKYLVLFFIPYGVGLMSYFHLIEDYWISITFAAVLSSLLTLYITALVLQKMEK